MKVTLEFDKSEESYELEHTINGVKYKRFIEEFGEELRKMTKYGAHEDKISEESAWFIRDMYWDLYRQEMCDE